MAVFYFLLSWAAPALKFLILLIFGVFLGYCVYVKYIHMKYDHIPGPLRDNFFLGHSVTLVRISESEGLIYDQFLEWATTYGPVYRINVLHHVRLVITCPEATKEILMSPKYPKERRVYERIANLFGQRFFGNGLATALDHKQWYKQRRIMDPAFSSLYLRGLMGTFNEEAEKLMNTLTDAADSNSDVNMLCLFNQVTLDVIAKVAFGVDVAQMNGSNFPKAISTCLKGQFSYLRNRLFEFNPKNKPFIDEVRKACRLLRSTGLQWIHDRKTAIANGNDVPKDILTHIIKAVGKEERMLKDGEEMMLDNFVTFFIAGQETTANQLAFCVLELARHPAILERARKEVDDVIGMKQDISYDNLGELTYLSQVLKEILRLYPTAPSTVRRIPEDIVIDGIHIPGEVSCVFSTYVTGRMDKFFKDPLTFDPDRFHPDAAKPYYCYYPFSLGPRSCVGKTFAQIEAKVVMAKLLQRFDFSLLPEQTFDVVDTGTLRPRGVLVSISHRNYKK